MLVSIRWDALTPTDLLTAALAAYLVLFVAFRTVMSSQAANVLALLLSALANIGVNRRFTFGIRGTDGIVRHYAQGLVVSALGLAATSGSLLALHRWAPDPSRTMEVTVLVAANLVATVVRLIGLRRVYTTG